MKVFKNERLRKKMRADNYVGLAEQWLEAVAGEDYAMFQHAFLEDLYPGCRVGEIEATLPLPGFPAPVHVHVHMICDAGVFSVMGRGETYDAALYGAILNGGDSVITDSRQPKQP